MKKYLGFLCLSCMAVLLGGIAQAQVSNKVVFSDPDKEIVVTKDAPEFDIVLESNPTTGYSWVIEKCDINLVTQVKTAFYPPNGGTGNKLLVGAPGYQKWTFKVVNPVFFTGSQNTSIALIYKRPWEKQAIKTLEFKVVSNNAN